jgi:hypothetical protein
LRAHQPIETVGVGTRVGISYDLPAGAVVGGIGQPPQNLANRKWYFQFGQQFSMVEFLHGREVSLDSKVVEVGSERIREAGK